MMNNFGSLTILKWTATITVGQDYVTPILIDAVTDTLNGIFVDSEGCHNAVHIGYCCDDALVGSVLVVG